MVPLYGADDGRFRVLDNTGDSIAQLSARLDLLPQLALNRSGQCEGSPEWISPAMQPSDIRPWRDLLARIGPDPLAGP